MQLHIIMQTDQETTASVPNESPKVVCSRAEISSQMIYGQTVVPFECIIIRLRDCFGTPKEQTIHCLHR
jgi:hypothetical protein